MQRWAVTVIYTVLLSIVISSVLALSPDGYIFYQRAATNTVLGDNYTNGDFTAGNDVLPNIGGVPLWIEAQWNHKRNESLIGVQDSVVDINVLVINMTSKATLFAFEYTNAAPITSAKSVDVTYESVSGEGLVVWDISTADGTINYSVWNGTAMSVNATFNVATATTTTRRFMRLYPDPDSNRIMLAYNDALNGIGAALWDGSAWVNITNISGTGVVATNRRPFDFAWYPDGNGVLFYANSSGTVAYSSFTSNSGAWDAGTDAIDIGATAQALDTCVHPTRNYVGVFTTDSGNDANVFMWNGTAVETNPAQPGEDIGIETGGHNSRCEWERSGEQAVFLFTDSNALTIDYFHYNMSADGTSRNWSVTDLDNAPTAAFGADDIQNIKMRPSPYDDTIMITEKDLTTLDIRAVLWNGSSIAATTANFVIEGTGVTAAAQSYEYVWNRYPSDPPVITSGVNDSSNSTNPTNAGSFVNFTANATDPEGQQWRLVVCTGAEGTLRGTCYGTPLCTSSYVNSGAIANCTYTVSSVEANYSWFAYACDNSSMCSPYANSTAPYVVNVGPRVHSVSVTPSPGANGTTATISVNATDPHGVSVVAAAIYYPNGTFWQNITLSGSNPYTNTFTVPVTPTGTYSVTVWTNDSINAVNNSVSGSFAPYINITSYASIAIDGAFSDWATIYGIQDENDSLAVSDSKNWTNATPSTPPAARISLSMTFDEQLNKVLLFGGAILLGDCDGHTDAYCNGTYAYNATDNKWYNLQPATPPAGRFGAAMTFDHNLNRTILFGGTSSDVNCDGSGDVLCNGTYAYNATDNKWYNLQPATPPSARSGAAMVFDRSINKTILFGGAGGSPCDGDIAGCNGTYAYNATDNKWYNLQPENPPPGRSRHGIGFDESANRIILFGGTTTFGSCDGAANICEKTYAYNATDNKWYNLTPVFSPTGREGIGLVYNPYGGGVLMFGGTTSASGCDGTGDTLCNGTYLFDFDGNTWVSLQPSDPPSPRSNHGIAYDKQNNNTVLYGGTSLSGCEGTGSECNDTHILNYSNAIDGEGLDIINVSITNSNTMLYTRILLDGAKSATRYYRVFVASAGARNTTSPSGATIPANYTHYAEVLDTACTVYNSSRHQVGTCATANTTYQIELNMSLSAMSADSGEQINISVETATTTPYDFSPNRQSFVAHTVSNLTPALNNVQAINVTTMSAVITWDTNILANSSVRYGRTTALTDGSNSSSTFALSRNLSLSLLRGGTQYYYNVTSCDGPICNTTGPHTFTTLNSVCVNETGLCYATIQFAINAASPGQTVVITDNNVYPENLSINKVLTLTSNGTQYPLITDNASVRLIDSTGFSFTARRLRLYSTVPDYILSAVNLVLQDTSIVAQTGVSYSGITNTIERVNITCGGGGGVALLNFAGNVRIDHTAVSCPFGLAFYGESLTSAVVNNSVFTTSSSPTFYGSPYIENTTVNSTFSPIIVGPNAFIDRSTFAGTTGTMLQSNTLVRNSTFSVYGPSVNNLSLLFSLPATNVVIDSSYITNAYGSRLVYVGDDFAGTANLSINVSLINTTATPAGVNFSNININDSAHIYFQHYLNVNVTNTTAPIASASIETRNSAGILLSTLSTNTTGQISTQNITYALVNNTGSIQTNHTYTNHTINATKRFFTNTTSVNMSSIQSVLLHLYIWDEVAPEFSNIFANVSATRVNITWSTNEAANSSVQYGTTTALAGGSNSSASLVTSHERWIYGLLPGTLYYYNITSCDVQYNCNTTGPYNFTTFTYVNLTSCGTLDENNTEYRLTQNITHGSGECIAIIATNITLDGKGYTIDTNAGAAYGINISTNLATVKNTFVTRFATGIYINTALNNTILNNTVGGTGCTLAIRVFSWSDYNTIRNNDMGCSLRTDSESARNAVEWNNVTNGSFLLWGDNEQARHNIVKNTLTGMHIANNYKVVEHNIIDNVTTGIAAPAAIEYTNLTNNTINNFLYGYDIRGANQVTISNGTLTNGSVAIDLRRGSSRGTYIINNTVLANITDYSLLTQDNLSLTIAGTELGTYYILNLLNLTVQNTHGIIAFLQPLNGTGSNFSSDIRIEANNASVESTNQPGFNKSANITLHNIPVLSNPRIMRDQNICPANVCTAFTPLVGTVEFNVSSWTDFSIQAASSINAVSPANDTIIDRDETQADPDFILLNVSTTLNDGRPVTFKASLTSPFISGQDDLTLGTNTTSGGYALLYFNPASNTYYAGNYTWWGENPSASTLDNRTFTIRGTHTHAYRDVALNPNNTYFQNDTARTEVNLTSSGLETPILLNNPYGATVNARFTNTTGSNSLEALTIDGSGTFWEDSNPVFNLLTLGGLGVWNHTIISTIDWFYTPANVERNFTVYGYMNITSNTTTPSSVNIYHWTTTACRVQDQHTEYDVAGANVTFYVDLMYAGSNVTNASGTAVLSHQVNVTGTHILTCNVSDQPSIYYYRGDAGDGYTDILVDQFPMTPSAPANDTVVDRDGTNSSDPDVLELIATFPSYVPDGLPVDFRASLTDHPFSATQANVFFGNNTTSGGAAVVYFNPDSSIYAGNYTWWANSTDSTANGTLTLVVRGSVSVTFNNSNADPSAQHFQNETVFTLFNATSYGPEGANVSMINSGAAILHSLIDSIDTTLFPGTSVYDEQFGGSLVPFSMSGEVGIWTAEGSVIGPEFASANYFYTNTTNRTFIVNGYMNITSNSTSPANINAMQYTTTVCSVAGQFVPQSVPNANVTFYRNGLLIGSNLTNSSGHAQLTYQVNATGTHVITCNVTDQPNIYYYSGDAPEQNGTLTVLSNPPVFAGSVNDSSNNTSPTNERANVTFVANATDVDGDTWRLIVCSNSTLTGVDCAATNYCNSTYVASGAYASCQYNTTGLVLEQYNWSAFACDPSNQCSAFNNDTSPFVINHAPGVLTVILSPSSPNATNTLTCNPLISDPDSGDIASATYAWYVRNESSGAFSLVSGQTASSLGPSFFDSNDEVACSVTPIDNHGFAGSASNSSLIINKGNLSAYSTLAVTQIQRLSATTINVSCGVSNGDGESVSVILQDNRTGSYSQSNTSTDAVYVNSSSITIGRLASQNSSNFTITVYTNIAGNYSFRAVCSAADTEPASATSAAETLTVTADTTPPVISNVFEDNIELNTATIVWTTDDLSDSTVDYGLSENNLDDSVINPTDVTSHSIVLINLAPATTYHYNVTSCNVDDYCSTAGPFNFTTGALDTPGAAFEDGYCTARVIEPGPNYREGYVSKGDIVEFYCEMPHRIKEREDVTLTLTNNEKQMRERIDAPPIIAGNQVVLYP